MLRAGLTETKVLDEIRQMADEIGLSQLTLAALAARLRVPQPSFYRAHRRHGGLRRGLAIRAKRLTRGVSTALATGPTNQSTAHALAMTAYTGVNLRSPEERS